MKTNNIYDSASLRNLNNNHYSKYDKYNKSSKKEGFLNSEKNYSDRESISNAHSKGRRIKLRRNSNCNSMKSNKSLITKKRNMDLTNYTYREAVSRLKYLLAESYASPINKSSIYGYSRNDDSADDQSDNQSVSIRGMERPALSEISKYLSPSYKPSTRNTLRRFKTYSPLSKENFSMPTYGATTDYLAPSSHGSTVNAVDTVQAPPEILNFIEKQEDYIEQLEKESTFCRNELSNLLGKVKDVINENEVLTEHAKSDFVNMANKSSSSSESEDKYSKIIQKKKDKSNKYNLEGPNIVFESRISELEAELTQANIDLKKLRTENDELKRKITFSTSSTNDNSTADAFRRQIENLQRDKLNLEEQIKKLQKTVETLRSESDNFSSKRHREIADMAMFEKSQSEIEIKHLRDDLERQHERIRELQHEMTRRIAEERSNAERRYNFQVDQLGGDLSSQWEHVSKLQIDLERQKRIEADLKRDLAQRNAQIEDLKTELKAKRVNFLSDIAQLNAEKQSFEQETQSLRMQLEKSERQAKVEAARLNAEIISLRQRLDRADADLLHTKRENLRLSDEIASLEQELTLGEMKNEVRPTSRDLSKTITEMQEKHEGTVRELEEMIQNQRQLMDKLTNECKTLTNRLEDTTLKHKMEISSLQSNVEILKNKIINSDRDRIIKNDNYSTFSTSKKAAPSDYTSPQISTTDSSRIRKSSDDQRAGDQSSPINKNLSHDYKTNNAEITTTRNEPNSVISPTDRQTFETTYNYGDDENVKDRFGKGDKFRSNEKFDTTDNNVGERNNDNQQYNVQSSDTDYTSQYQTNYEQPEYVQPQYDGSGYESNYDQSYDQPYQQYEGNEQYQGDEQYTGDQQYQESEQYAAYTGDQQQYQPGYETGYEQPYRPESSVYKQQQQSVPVSASGSSIPNISTAADSVSNDPTTSSTAAAKPSPPLQSTTAAGKRESRLQPRTGDGTLGSSSIGGGGGETSTNVLSKQPSETNKGIPTTTTRT